MNAPRLYSSARKCLLMSFLGFFALKVPVNKQIGKMCNYNKMTLSSTPENTCDQSPAFVLVFLKVVILVGSGGLSLLCW